MLDSLVERWTEIVPRMSLALAASAGGVHLVLRRWPTISPEWRHRLWCAVVFQGLLWVTIPLVRTEVVSLGAASPAPGAEATAAGSGESAAAPRGERALRGRELPAREATFPGAESFDLGRWGFFAWLTTAGVLAAALALRYLRFQQRLGRTSIPASAEIRRASAIQAARLGLSASPEVRVSPLCLAPFVFGLWRPVVFLPERLDVVGDERDALLAHELAHVQRRDALVEVLSLAACVLNFFHPAIWWARRELAAARERCVDRAVVDAAQHSAHTYAGALLQVAESLAVPSRVLGLSSGRSAGELRGRIEELLKSRHSPARLLPARLALAALLLATAASLISVRLETVVLAEEPRNQEAAPRAAARQLALADEPKPVPSVEAQPIRHEELVKGLKYLAGVQREDGSLEGDSYGKNVGVVSLVGLAFVGSVSKPREGEYRKELSRALAFVKSRAAEDGYLLSAADARPGSMYDHGFATLFLARVYPLLEGKDKDDVKAILEKAVALIVASQGPDGGWRYQPTAVPNGDLTIGVCQITALDAARRAGIKAPQTAFDSFAEFLQQARTDDGSYRYVLGAGAGSFTRTGAGLFASYVVDMGPDAAPKGLKHLEENRPPSGASFQYYGHWYAAQAMRRAGGNRARDWHKAAGEAICRQQSKDGSWSEVESAALGTALACLILESPIFDATGKK